MQTSPLSCSSFFKTYISQTQSKDLSTQDRKIALVASIILGILFAGIPQLISLLINRCKKIELTETPLVKITPLVNKNYLEIINRIAPAEKKQLEAFLEAIPKEEVEKFVMTNYPWQGFTVAPLYALKAVKMNLMTPEQFATVCLFTAAIPRHKMALQKYSKPQKVHPVQISLFNSDGSKNKQAEAIISETLCPWSNTDPWLTQDKLNEFFNRATQLPKSEQQFLVIGDCDQFGGGSVCLNIYEMRCNLFGCFVKHNNIPLIEDLSEENRGKLRLIPSGGMMQTVLDVLGPLKANFVIGADEKESEEHNITLPFKPWVSIPDTIQGLKAPDIDYTYCEFFYALTHSVIPLQHQKLGKELQNLPLIKAFKNFKDKIKEFYLPTHHNALFHCLTIPKTSDMGFWGAIDYSLRHIDPKDPNYIPCLKELVDFLVVKEKGKPFGVTAKGLFDLSEKMDNCRNDLLSVPTSFQGPNFCQDIEIINQSPIWKLLEIWQTMR